MASTVGAGIQNKYERNAASLEQWAADYQKATESITSENGENLKGLLQTIFENATLWTLAGDFESASQAYAYGREIEAFYEVSPQMMNSTKEPIKKEISISPDALAKLKTNHQKFLQDLKQLHQSIQDNVKAGLRAAKVEYANKLFEGYLDWEKLDTDEGDPAALALADATLYELGVSISKLKALREKDSKPKTSEDSDKILFDAPVNTRPLFGLSDSYRSPSLPRDENKDKPAPKVEPKAASAKPKAVSASMPHVVGGAGAGASKPAPVASAPGKASSRREVFEQRAKEEAEKAAKAKAEQDLLAKRKADQKERPKAAYNPKDAVEAELRFKTLASSFGAGFKG